MAQVLGWLLLLLFCSSAQSFLWRRTRGSYSSKGMHPSRAGSFPQKLDHFSKNSSQLWPQVKSNDQRYFINDAFYKPGGPVFLMIGGAWIACESWVSISKTWVTYAERLGALFLLLEHRFYGHSQPTGDLSTASLHYLSSRQALADIANFRTEIAKKMGLTKNNWVAYGCSYGGSLAVWSRLKHPDLFAAAVGSSAPIKAKANFYEYLEVVQRSLATHNSKCFQTVKEAFDQVVKMLRFPKYYRKLERDFTLCKRLKLYSAMDKAYFLERLIFPVELAVQHNKNEKNDKILSPSTPGTLFIPPTCSRIALGEQLSFSMDELCDAMANTSLGSPYHRYVRIILLTYKDKYSPCFAAHYRTKLKILLDTSIDHHDPNIGVISTNAYYGGFNMTGSKIIFPNGSFDPWHPLGITKDISKDLPAVFIKGAVHCADMFEQNDTDSAELIQAREKIFQLLQKWLKQ
ncbi:putative serine protease K12H4.7 [Elephas maximus indicus]|uniref:putative serine protease K12H4.7 n=1 Tax=Elephas maximus indicus TaxID=99487 RepID=UPI002116C44A|nr:putative serine protease K12H4.7 [Elephas maximus indicus]